MPNPPKKLPSDAKKINANEVNQYKQQGFKFIGPGEGGIEVYEKPGQTFQAKTGGKQSSDLNRKFLIDQLQSGVSPEELVAKGHASNEGIAGLRSYYKPNTVFTTPPPPIPKQTPPLGYDLRIDRKIIEPASTQFYKAYDYPDANAGYSKATRKYFDVKTNQEIDPAKSFSSAGAYNPNFLNSSVNSTQNLGTIKLGTPQVSPSPLGLDVTNQTGKPMKSGTKQMGDIGFRNGGYTHGNGLMKHIGYADGGQLGAGAGLGSSGGMGGGGTYTGGNNSSSQGVDFGSVAGMVAPEVANFGGNIIDMKTQDAYGRYNTGSKAGDYFAGTGSGALKGAGKGAAMGSQYGLAGMLIGAGAGALMGGATGAIKTSQDRKSIESEKEQQKIAELYAQQAKRKQAFQYSLGKERGQQMNMKEGGMVKGAGTAKSDSIKAKVKPGSFVVPAENVGVAKEIKKKVFPKAPVNKKADLNQDGGEEIRLSNGEYVFSKEEVKELKSMGIDLAKLAPMAEHGNVEMANGGLTPEKAHQMLKDNSAHGKPLSSAQRKYFGWVYSKSKK